jgi:hypothetical protein
MSPWNAPSPLTQEPLSVHGFPSRIGRGNPPRSPGQQVLAAVEFGGAPDRNAPGSVEGRVSVRYGSSAMVKIDRFRGADCREAAGIDSQRVPSTVRSITLSTNVKLRAGSRGDEIRSAPSLQYSRLKLVGWLRSFGSRGDTLSTLICRSSANAPCGASRRAGIPRGAPRCASTNLGAGSAGKARLRPHSQCQGERCEDLQKRRAIMQRSASRRKIA